MIRVVQYDVIRTLGTGAYEEAGFGHKGWVIETKRRKIVRIETDVVLLGNAAGTRAERAPILGHLRTVLAVRRYDHPFPAQRVPAEFIHSVHFFILGVTFQTLAAELPHPIR